MKQRDEIIFPYPSQNMYIILVHPSMVIHWNIVRKALPRLSKLVKPQLMLSSDLESLQRSFTLCRSQPWSYASGMLPQKFSGLHYRAPHELRSEVAGIQSPLIGVAVVQHLQWMIPLQRDRPSIANIRKKNVANAMISPRARIDWRSVPTNFFMFGNWFKLLSGLINLKVLRAEMLPI